VSAPGTHDSRAEKKQSAVSNQPKRRRRKRAISSQPKQKAPLQSPESPRSRVIADIGKSKQKALFSQRL
jgi:hypothetical protein